MGNGTIQNLFEVVSCYYTRDKKNLYAYLFPKVATVLNNSKFFAVILLTIYLGKNTQAS